MDLQVVRLARHVGKLAQGDGVVHRVLGHMPVGRPLAAHNGQQTRVIDMDGVIARERRRLARSPIGFHQRTNADIDAEHITALWRAAEVLGSGVENELDLFLEGKRVIGRFLNRRIGRAHHRVLMPGDGKQHPAVAGVRHHDGGVAAQKLPLEDQVDTLAGRDHAVHLRLCQPAHFVGEDARCIHHHMSGYLHALTGFAIDRDHPIRKAVGAPG